MNVQVEFAEEIRIDAVTLRVRPHPTERRAHRFLHHLAQVPGHGELLPAARLAGFDENDVAAYRGPNQAHRNSRFGYPLFHFLFDSNFLYSERFANHFWSNDMLFGLTFGDAPSLLAHERSNFALEVSHAGFSRVMSDQVMYGFVGELNLLTQNDAMLFRLPRNQEALRDSDLLFFRITGEFDDLHAVSQGLRNRIHPV